jgi:hypothetical protein
MALVNRHCELVCIPGPHGFLFFLTYDRIKILTEELSPLAGQVNRNGRLRVCVNSVGIFYVYDNYPQWLFRSASR